MAAPKLPYAFAFCHCMCYAPSFFCPCLSDLLLMLPLVACVPRLCCPFLICRSRRLLPFMLFANVNRYPSLVVESRGPCPGCPNLSDAGCPSLCRILSSTLLILLAALPLKFSLAAPTAACRICKLLPASPSCSSSIVLSTPTPALIFATRLPLADHADADADADALRLAVSVSFNPPVSSCPNTQLPIYIS